MFNTLFCLQEYYKKCLLLSLVLNVDSVDAFFSLNTQK